MAKILIVDDDYSNRLLVTTLLRHAGHVVFEASEGKQALELATRYRLDLMIVDLWLPGMSGTELVRAARELAETSQVPIALYTATTVYPALRDFMELYGVLHVIPKPSEPQTLLGAIEAALHGGGALRS